MNLKEAETQHLALNASTAGRNSLFPSGDYPEGRENPFRVVMSGRGAPLGPGEKLFDRLEGEPDRADSHDRAIPKAVVRLANALEGPVVKHAPVSAPGVGVGIRVQRVDQILSGEDPIGRGDGEKRVVGKGRSRDNEGKVFCLGRCAFMNRTNNISYDRTEPDDCLYPPNPCLRSPAEKPGPVDVRRTDNGRAATATSYRLECSFASDYCSICESSALNSHLADSFPRIGLLSHPLNIESQPFVFRMGTGPRSPWFSTINPNK